MRIAHISFSIALFFVGCSMAVSPYELLRYNARFCKGSLKQVVYATLKPYTHKGCLEGALSKLQKNNSKLYNEFDHAYVGNSKIKVIKNHRMETKDLLIYAMEGRLGKSREKNRVLTTTTDFGRKLFVQDIASFCSLMGDYKLLADYQELNDRQVDFKTLTASFVLAQAKTIDLYNLFSEYRSFLVAFEKNKKVNSVKKKEILKDIKKIRDVFLILLDNLVVLKKRMSQLEDKKFTKDQLLQQRIKVRNALVGIAGARRHIDHVEKALRALNPTQTHARDEVIGALAQDYPNFFCLLNLIRYTDLLSNGCLKD